jgi:hypothetical protein
MTHDDARSAAPPRLRRSDADGKTATNRPMIGTEPRQVGGGLICCPPDRQK